MAVVVSVWTEKVAVVGLVALLRNFSRDKGSVWQDTVALRLFSVIIRLDESICVP